MRWLRVFASIAVVAHGVACDGSPLEEPARLFRDGRCTEALPAIDEIEARADRWASGARAMRAICLYETAAGREGSSEGDWIEAAAAIRGSLEESEGGGPALPEGIEAVDAAGFGRAAEEIAAARLARSAPGEALEALEDAAGRAEFTIRATSLSGEAKVALGRWAGGAVDLDAAAAGTEDAAERGRLLRIAAGAWHGAGQTEKALVDFARAEREAPLPWRYPERLIEEGEEPEHYLGELIAASVHGVLLRCFARDWESLEGAPRKMNFFVAKRDKDLLEAQEQVAALGAAAAGGRGEQGTDGAPFYLYEILNMRALVKAGGGDYRGAILDLQAARALDPQGEEAPANLAILEAISAPFRASRGRRRAPGRASPGRR